MGLESTRAVLLLLQPWHPDVILLFLLPLPSPWLCVPQAYLWLSSHLIVTFFICLIWFIYLSQCVSEMLVSRWYTVTIEGNNKWPSSPPSDMPNNFLFGPPRLFLFGPRLFGVAYINNVVIEIFLCSLAVNVILRLCQLFEVFRGFES